MSVAVLPGVTTTPGRHRTPLTSADPTTSGT